jgi:serine/threonine-protein kinase RsbW
MTTLTAVRYSASFPGRPEQVRKVRRAVAGCLAGCPAADDMVLIASELATNAVRHSASRGAFFAVRVEVLPGGARVEVEDLGGPWHPRQRDGRPHGLDVVQALAGPDGWGVTSLPPAGRVVWARVSFRAC